MQNNVEEIIIGITGASGAIYGVTALKALQKSDIKTHLIISKTAQITLNLELGIKPQELYEIADYTHPSGDMAACISSGSFKTKGMLIAPCSMKTLGEIASGVTSSLISRAADVTLKERRRLVLMVRETPLNQIHLENMLKLSKMGADICPPVPAFYNNPNSIEDIVNHSVGRALDLFDIDADIVKRWNGIK